MSPPSRRLRQAELFEAAIAAIEAGDLAALSTPAAELLDVWVSQPDPHPLAVVKAELGRLRAVEAGQRGAEIARRFAAACDAQDYPAAAAADATYKALLAEGYFQPDDATNQTIASCCDWFVAAATRHQTDDAFARDLATLQEALAQPQPGEDVDRVCERYALTAANCPPNSSRKPTAPSAAAAPASPGDAACACPRASRPWPCPCWPWPSSAGTWD